MSSYVSNMLLIVLMLNIQFTEVLFFILTFIFLVNSELWFPHRIVFAPLSYQ